MRHRIASFIAATIVLAGCGASASVAEPGRPAPTEASHASPGSTVDPPSSEPPVTAAATTAALPDMALVGADGRIAVVRHGSIGEPVTGIVAADDHTLIETRLAASAAGPSTTVIWSRLSDGVVTGSTTLAGELRPSATDLTGEVVALVGTNPDAPNGTEIVIARQSGERFRQRYDVELVPEGFSNAFVTDLPIGMFVQEFLDPPLEDPEAPRWYQVRVLDTATGALQLPLNLRDKSQQVDEQMLGFGRTHLTSPQNGLLFTLYRGFADDNSNYAFVHTLGFVNGVWCLDLPSELDLEWELGGLGLFDDESRLIVASANGFVTEFAVGDITDPAVTPAPRRTVRSWTPGSEPDGPTIAVSADAMVVGQGSVVRWIDPETLTETRSIDSAIVIESISFGGDHPLGAGVILAGSGSVTEIGPAGDPVSMLALPEGFAGVERILMFGAD